jgi:hypothetical protein
MSMRASAARLTAATRELSNHWQETKYYWRDAKSAEFERKYLQELLATVDRTVAIMEQLDKLLAKIKDDCE